MNEPKTNSVKPKYLVSACLVGCHCRYDGKNQAREEMIALYQKGEALALCPEELAGLGTPREPCEKSGARIISRSGRDQTDAYLAGAQKALAMTRQAGLRQAFLKSKSPMCGHGRIYDGSFTGQLKEGDGQFTEFLLAEGIEVIAVD